MQTADMEFAAADWLDYEPDLSTPAPLTPGVETQAAGQSVDSGSVNLPLLRLPDWEESRQYDSAAPVCIHYDIQWKVSQYIGQNKRASQVWKNTEPNLVLAPGDYWEKILEGDIDNFLKEKLGEVSCQREEIHVTVSVERSRGHRLSREVRHQSDWDIVHEHLASLSGLFQKGKRITVDIDLSYREVDQDTPRSAGRKKKKRKATEAQRAEMEAEMGLYRDVYKKLRCDAQSCKSGPHCAVDPQGNHIELIPYHIEKIVDYVKNGGQFDGPRDIPADIVHELYKAAAAKGRSTSSPSASSSSVAGAQLTVPARIDDVPPIPSPLLLRGKWDERIDEYCNFLKNQVDCEDWQNAIEVAGTVARKRYLELEFSHAEPKFASKLLIAGGVQPPIAGQWVRNIKRFSKERHVEAD